MNIRDMVPCSFRNKRLPLRYDEHGPFSLLEEGMDGLFEDLFKGFDLMPFQISGRTFNPKVNISETDKELTISAELPGIDEKEVDVSISKDVLTIKGEKKEENEKNGENYHHVECSYGSFSRDILIPEDVELDKVDARFKKGVLTVTLPKTAKAIKEKKKIAINVEG